MKAKILIAVTVAIAALIALWALLWRVPNITAPEINTGATEAPVRLFEPEPNQTISSPLALRGEARGTWFFEASFPVRLLDGNGRQIAVIPAQAQSDWMTEAYVPFEATLTFDPPATETGILVLEKDNPSGLPEYSAEIAIPIRFGQTAEPMTIKAFFGNSALDPGVLDCNKVFAVERVIPKTETPARAVLEELLAGPTTNEAAEGYFTSINAGVEIQRLVIEDGIAKADFNPRLDEDMDGSCRVAAIRSQITETLKQFASVTDVIISINGETDLILQP